MYDCDQEKDQAGGKGKCFLIHRVHSSNGRDESRLSLYVKIDASCRSVLGDLLAIK
jgi:hypothetical protein